MGFFRRLLGLRPRKRKLETRPREKPRAETLGQRIDFEKRHVEEVSTGLLRKITDPKTTVTEIQVDLQELYGSLHENPIVARESQSAAQTVLELFRTTQSRGIKILCARLLIIMHSAKNMAVVSQLPIVLRKEKDLQVLAFFRNINK